MALKRHFTSEYDYFKHGGKTRTSREAFAARRDRRYFEDLAKKPDWRRFLLANMVHDPNQWIGNLFTDSADEVYKNWIANQNAMTYNFTMDVRKLNQDFNLNFAHRDGHHPYLLTLYLSGQVQLESMVILDELLDFRKQWDRTISEKYVWPSVSLKIRKYAPFLSFDKKKMKQKMLELIT